MRIVKFCVVFLVSISAFAQGKQWPPKEANVWYDRQPWLIGSNYIPATAINELEMWQKETFDPARIDLEFGWAERLGMNTMRVFLHDLLWQQDAKQFSRNIDKFLSLAEKHHIKPMFVLFDSCWDPDPKLGPQRAPKPGVHNSGWVQSPGRRALSDPEQAKRLEQYVKGVVGKFARDRRILAWDVWNEPDNLNDSSYKKDEPSNKIALVNALLPQVFRWAREAGAAQPLTSGVWKGNWTSDAALSATEQIQLGQSDVISFHSYEKPDRFEERVRSLERYGRPILCTEYMARGNGSTFSGTLPVARKYHVAAMNWGFVAGKTQTNLPWDSWKRPYTDREPAIWFHEIFDFSGKPYRQDEVDLLRKLTGSTLLKKAA